MEFISKTLSFFPFLGLRFLALATILLHFGCRDSEHYTSREIDGVTARFEIETPRVFIGQRLKVKAFYKNQSQAPILFRYLPPLFDAQIWRGTVEEPVCVTQQMEHSEVTLNPGQEYVVEDELSLGQYCHEPGQHEVRFYYNLNLLVDKQRADEYRKRYPVVRETISWEDRGHPFTISK